jgi:hypothetical protein
MLGLINQNEKDYDTAEKYYLKDAKICERQGDIIGLIQSKLNLGRVYE